MQKVLVVCVDIDDDVGQKIKVKGPIIGIEENIETAKQLLLVDPSESDANAMFEAVKLAKEVKAVDVVTLTGHYSRSYKAHEKISEQLKNVLKKYTDIDGIYLVTDGANDDEIIPVLQAQTDILSKTTCIVNQAQHIEKSYYVIKEALKDPHFARLIFGLPGVILLIGALLQDIGIKLIILFIGFYLLMKGFGIEEPLLNSFRNFRSSTSIERASFPLYIGAMLTLLLALFSGYDQVVSLKTTNVMILAATFVQGFITLFTLSVVMFIIGRLGDMHFRREFLKIKKYSLSVVAFLALWLVTSKAAELVLGNIMLDEFVVFVVIAFLATIVGLALVRVVYINRFITSKLKKDMEVYDAEGNEVGKISEIDKAKNMIKIAVKGTPEKMIVKLSNFVVVQKEDNFAVARIHS